MVIKPLRNTFVVTFIFLVMKFNCTPLLSPTNNEYDSRVQKIKEDILSKLGFDDIPSSRISKENLPSSLLSDDAFYKLQPRSYADNETKEIVIKKKMIILGQVVLRMRCGSKHCLSIEFKDEIPADLEIRSIELWVHRKSEYIFKPSYFSLYFNNSKGRKELLHYSESHIEQSSWLTMEQHAKKVLMNGKNGIRYLRFEAELECENCYFSRNANQQPFIALKVIKKIKQRARRGISENCSGYQSCCRKSLTIDFKEIGWDNWIISPKSYNAYYCKGDCSRHSDHTSTYKHTGVLKAIAVQSDRKDISYCCTPKRFSSLIILYMSDGNIIRREIENMIVEECWCV